LKTNLLLLLYLIFNELVKKNNENK